MGFYDLIVVTVGLIVPVASLQLAESIYRWLLDIEEKDLKKIISSSLFTLLFAIGVVLIIYYFVLIFFDLEYKNEIGGYFVIFTLYPFFLAVARGLKLNKLYAASGIVNSGLLVSLNWLFLAHFSLGVKALFMSNIIANAITILFLIIGTKLFRYVSIKSYSKLLVGEFIKYSLPLIPNAVSWWFINSANRYLIIYFLGQEKNGVYALSSRLAMALYAINSIFNLAWQESAITEFNKEHRDKLYSETFNRYFVLEFSIIILLIPLSKIYVQNFVSEVYSDSWKFIPVLFVGVAFSTFATFFATGYMSAKKTIGAFSTTIFGALANIGSAIIFIPLLGLQGAALSLTIGFFVTWCLRVRQTKSYFQINFNIKKMIKIIVFLIVSLISVFVVDSLIGLIIFSILSLIVFITENRYLISKIFSKIKNSMNLRRV